jgi:succinoglycan biosynthesis protein ExoM
MHISVCVCSYRRPALLQRTLSGLRLQKTHSRFDYSVVVCDNDPAESARPVANSFAGTNPEVIYCAEPRRGIAHARNKAVESARGDYIAFIDDDEVPEQHWLRRLYETLIAEKVDAVLGPVRPLFDSPPPAWIVKGRLCERPEHPTGYLMPWTECRTGNVLFRKDIAHGVEPLFVPEFVTGSDVHFFMRMAGKGRTFAWCNEAVVHEVVSPNRWRRSFMLKRALLRGSHQMKKGDVPIAARVAAVGRSVVAVPAYTLLLPFLQLAGHHHFMKYMIKWCDHVGRLLAVLRIELVTEREV